MSFLGGVGGSLRTKICSKTPTCERFGGGGMGGIDFGKPPVLRVGHPSFGSNFHRGKWWNGTHTVSLLPKRSYVSSHMFSDVF